ncbi:hypothetical protein ACIGCK_08470, partial [Microbacterium sp. NPDC078428]|uniref:hypothetical protein n=1 Tax=Microbacterium sp. NPDC078428 TaxID=3364190 RepID=UPI0037C82716
MDERTAAFSTAHKRKRTQRSGVDMSVVETSAGVRTGLFIGGVERHTGEVLSVVDPARPGVV